jgi:hypothetical protein
MSSSELHFDALMYGSSRSAEPPNKLMRCSRCSDGVGTSYCSKECQKIDWPKHKPVCDIFVSEINLTEIGALASPNQTVAVDIFNNYVRNHLRLQLRLATISAYRLADPTSTLCDTHLFAVDYYVNPRLQHYHQQVQFEKTVLWMKDEWIAKQVRGRNRSGDSQYEEIFRSRFTLEHVDPAGRKKLALAEKKGLGLKRVTIVVNLLFRNRNPEPECYTLSTSRTFPHHRRLSSHTSF